MCKRLAHLVTLFRAPSATPIVALLVVRIALLRQKKKQIYVSLYRAQSTEYRAQCLSFSMFEFILLDLDTAGGKDSWTRSGSRYH